MLRLSIATKSLWHDCRRRESFYLYLNEKNQITRGLWTKCCEMSEGDAASSYQQLYVWFYCVFIFFCGASRISWNLILSQPLHFCLLYNPPLHTQTHTQTYIKFLDTEGGTVCFMPVPEVVGGHQLTATVIDLSPWVEYEFRVLASNTIGTGEPSKPSKQARTKGTCMYRMSRKNVLSPLLKMYSMFVSSPLAWRMSLTSSFLQRNGNNGWVQAWRCIFLPRFSWEDWYYCHVC